MLIVFSSFKAIKDTSPTYKKKSSMHDKYGLNIIVWLEILMKDKERGKYKVNSPNF
jgi:hypothetical protein